MERGWKVTDALRSRKVGVAAAQLDHLKKKACDKLQICDEWESCDCYVAEDGTLVDSDEYLLTLRPQTLLIITKRGQIPKTEFEFQLSKIMSAHKHIIEVRNAIQTFFKDNPQEIQTIQKYINPAEEINITKSKLEEDPEWFKDIETRVTTKEGYMRYRARSRTRSYFYKIKTLLKNSSIYKTKTNGRKEIDTFINKLEKVLSSNRYHDYYFDRKSDERDKFCDDNGKFTCEGLWNRNECEDSDHKINPYVSKSERILFQTWNLDHGVELSRTVAPGILEALNKIADRSIGKCYWCKCEIGAHLLVAEYYKLLFTRRNLKLVHIVCHDKRKHESDECTFVVCEKCYCDEQKSSKSIRSLIRTA